jgi:hypothetical protein
MSDLPSAAEVIVQTGALRKEAGVWDLQAGQLAALSAKVTGMEFGRLEAGLFQVMIGPYNEVVHAVAARTSEGATAMHQIGHTLIDVAGTYEDEDKASEHRIRNVY